MILLLVTNARGSGTVNLIPCGSTRYRRNTASKLRNGPLDDKQWRGMDSNTTLINTAEVNSRLE